MTNGSRAFACEFLYKALDDAQGTIRALDTKAGVGIVVLGAMLGRVLEHDQLVAIQTGGWISAITASLFGILALLAALLAFRTIFPMIDPAQNVSLSEEVRPKFFVSKLHPIRVWRLFSSSSRFSRLVETHASYCETLQNTSDEDIERSIAAEVLKVSFIRQLKTDRLSGFAKILVALVLAFIALLWLVPPKESSEVDRRGPCMAGGNISVTLEAQKPPVIERTNKHR